MNISIDACRSSSGGFDVVAGETRAGVWGEWTGLILRPEGLQRRHDSLRLPRLLVAPRHRRATGLTEYGGPAHSRLPGHR